MEHLEYFQVWERPFLFTPFSFSCEYILESHNLKIKKIKASRNENFAIIGEVEGEIISGKALLPFEGKGKAGEFIEFNDLDVVVGSLRVTISKVYISDVRVEADGKFTGKILNSTFSATTSPEFKANRLLNYYLNCSRVAHFPRFTSRDVEVKSVLTRNSPGQGSKGKPDYDKTLTKGGSYRDHALLSNKYGEVIFCKVDEDDLEKKLGECYLEFKDSVKAIEKEYRDSWSEALSFILGKRLMSAGFSTFDENHVQAHRVASNIYSPNFEQELAVSSSEPFKYQDEKRIFFDESKVSHVVELLIENRDKYNLKEVYWKIWYSKILPSGLDVVALGTGLEILAKCWFETNQSKNSGCYVDPDEFASKFKDVDVVKSVKANLPQTPQWKKVINNIDGANRVGIGERNKKFFEELGLKIGEVEEEVMKARNKFVHDTTDDDNDALKRNVLISRAYETFLSRLILKVVGYTGEYIDYSTYGYPERKIDEPLGGPAGDGKI